MVIVLCIISTVLYSVMKMKVYLQTSLAEIQSPGTYQLGAANGVACLVARVALCAGWWCARLPCKLRSQTVLLSTVTVLF